MNKPHDEPTDEQREALRIARTLIDAGIPVFAAAPCPDGCKIQGHGRTEYHLPRMWEKIGPSVKQLERWRPGWALAAVGGWAADFLDQDDHHGGDVSAKELAEQGLWPRTFGQASTPSGGWHHLISPIREREANAFRPGLDYQGGDEAGEGRAFVWIAPTVKRSKNVADRLDDGTYPLGEYRWVIEPDLEMLAEYAGSDDSGQAVRDIIVGKRLPQGIPTVQSERSTPDSPHETPPVFGMSSDVLKAERDGRREFTTERAWEFVQPVLKDLREAVIGSIEERANMAAAMLSHFVPDFMSAEQGFSILCGALSHTAYDPNGPSSWTADKFKAVLDGRRPPRDNWRAVKVESGTMSGLAVESEATVDEVDALIGRMLTAQQMSERPAPDPLVWGLLDRDSLAAVVGMPGSFKSFWALDLAGHVGQGREWRGRRVHQGLCVYIAGEGDRGMTLRTRAWQERNGPMRDVLFLPEPVQIANPHAWDVLVKACAKLKPVFVVADTQSTMTIGMEENSNSEMNVAMDAFRRIQKASGACVLAVHHTTKDGSGVRGGSAQEGAHDTRIRLVRLEPRSSMIVKMVDEKQKDMAEGDSAGLKMMLDVVDLGTDPQTGRALSSLVIGDQSVDEYVEESARQDARPVETERTVTPEPEPWAVRLSGGSELRARLLQAVASVGQEEGLTMAEARRHTAARWYGGTQVRTGSAGLNISTFDAAWKTYAGLSKKPGSSEPALVNVGGQRYAVNTLHLVA